jgi:hypothetical protein
MARRNSAWHLAQQPKHHANESERRYHQSHLAQFSQVTPARTTKALQQLESLMDVVRIPNAVPDRAAQYPSVTQRFDGGPLPH